MGRSKRVVGQMTKRNKKNSTLSVVARACSTTPRSRTLSGRNPRNLCSFCFVREVEITEEQDGQPEQITALLEIITCQLGQDSSEVHFSEECMEELRHLCAGCKAYITDVWEKREAIKQHTKDIARIVEIIQQRVADGSHLASSYGLPSTSTLREPIIQSFVDLVRRRAEAQIQTQEQPAGALCEDHQHHHAREEQEMLMASGNTEDQHIPVGSAADDLERMSEEQQDSVIEDNNMNQEGNIADGLTSNEDRISNEILPGAYRRDENLPGTSFAVRIPVSDNTTLVDSGTAQDIKPDTGATTAPHSDWDSEDEHNIFTVSEKLANKPTQLKRKQKRQQVESFKGVKFYVCDGPGVKSSRNLLCSICHFFVRAPKKIVKGDNSPILIMHDHISEAHKHGPGGNCLVCEQHFPDMSSLRNHKATHTEEEQKNARERLKIRDALDKSDKNYMRTQKKKSEETACDVCFKNFPNRASWESHQAMHLQDLLRKKSSERQAANTANTP